MTTAEETTEVKTNVSLPIVYVRGFAGGATGIEHAVDDPFYGFNEGSTHVRVDGDDHPVFYSFEGPLLRLLEQEDYQLLVDGGQRHYLQTHNQVPPRSVWVHRFYDMSAGYAGTDTSTDTDEGTGTDEDAAGAWTAEPAAFSVEAAALGLLELIETLQVKTGAPRVHLVAHSMGGLIVRCMVQKIIPDKRPGHRATDYVDRIFTYATPHAGISFAFGAGMLEKLRDALHPFGAEIFGPTRMYQYLTPGAGPGDKPPADWSAAELPKGSFPLERIFCLVGTDSTDYDVAHGLSAFAVGSRSDGLVQIDNAQIPGAPHAYVHRSHSGRYGVVNSEEGYQNLRRFLFGDFKVQADLVGARLPGGNEDTDWQAEVRVSVRGLPVVTHERTAAHWCPIQLQTSPDGDACAAVPLVTTFISSDLDQHDGSDTARYALHLRVLSLREHHGVFSFRDHLEQVSDVDDILIVDLRRADGGGIEAWSAWNSQIPGPVRDYDPQTMGTSLADVDPAPGSWVSDIALPPNARTILGEQATVRLAISPWN